MFAPPNEVFSPTAVQLLLLPTNANLLTHILLYHVVPGNVTDALLVDDDDLLTLLDENVTVTRSSKIQVTLDGQAFITPMLELNTSNVTAVDLFASNGVIHTIDKVLAPPNLFEVMHSMGL